MIESFHVQNYKALRDVRVDLTPIHVLIGPNDSGKTSIVEALTALCRMVRLPLDQAFLGRWQGRELVWTGSSDRVVSFEVVVSEEGKPRLEHRISCQFPETGRNVTRIEESLTIQGRRDQPVRLNGGSPTHSALVIDPSLRDPHLGMMYDTLSGLQSYRWVPPNLALPVAYDFQTQFGMESSGFGLAMYLNDILAYDHEKYGELERRFRVIFPSVSRIRLRREPGLRAAPETSSMSSGLGIYFEQAEGGNLLPAPQASDGLLLVLAYLAILHSPQPPRLLLVEEPENGIHPRRLADILRVLKELVQEQNRTQVLLTTHSPYVVDLFRPEQVTLCLKGSDGAVTTHRLSESKSVREQMDIFQLGEIWTAEGDEALAAPANSDTTSLP